MQTTQKVVMLPTQKATHIILDRNNLDFIEKKQIASTINSIVIGYHLYILSKNDSKEGDLILNIKTGSIFKFEGLAAPESIDEFTILASTDETLTPDALIHQSFIKAYITAYMDKNPITEVSLEMKVVNINAKNKTGLTPRMILVPETRLDKTVIINKSEKFTRDEIYWACIKCIELYEVENQIIDSKRIKKPSEIVDYWMDKNY